MRRYTKTSAFTMGTGRCAAVIAAFTVITITSWAAFLDGAKWNITVTPDKAAVDKGEREFRDTVTFADGKLSSATFLAKGFKPGAYRGEEEANEAEFEVELTGASNSVVNWLGEIRGTNIVGRLTWTKVNGTNLMFNFQGTKQ